MYKVEFTKEGLRDFNKLDRKMQERILNFLDRIQIRPHHFLKRIGGTKYFRGRAGDYRIIFDVENRKLMILVLEIGHRRNIHKK